MSSLTFEQVATEELPVLYRMAKRMTRNATDAEDLVGQTLLAAAKGWSGFDGRYPRTWLIKIMTNVNLSNFRRQESRVETAILEDHEHVAAHDPWIDVDVKLVSDRIIDELDCLPEEYRMAVALCDVEELSYEEAGLAMQVPIGTVRSRLARGRRMLRERLAHLMSPVAT